MQNLACGDLESAAVRADREAAGARRHLSRKIEARALDVRARALAAMDRRDEAAEALEHALGVARLIEYPPVVWRSLFLAAELARRAGRDAEARRHTEEARALVGGLVRGLADPDLARGFRHLGERLDANPLGPEGRRLRPTRS
jgi:hypothetical protein